MSADHVQKFVLVKAVNAATPTRPLMPPLPTGFGGKRLGLVDNSKTRADSSWKRWQRFLISSMVSAILCATASPRHRNPWRLR